MFTNIYDVFLSFCLKFGLDPLMLLAVPFATMNLDVFDNVRDRLKVMESKKQQFRKTNGVSKYGPELSTAVFVYQGIVIAFLTWILRALLVVVMMILVRCLMNLDSDHLSFINFTAGAAFFMIFAQFVTYRLPEGRLSGGLYVQNPFYARGFDIDHLKAHHLLSDIFTFTMLVVIIVIGVQAQKIYNKESENLIKEKGVLMDNVLFYSFDSYEVILNRIVLNLKDGNAVDKFPQNWPESKKLDFSMGLKIPDNNCGRDFISLLFERKKNTSNKKCFSLVDFSKEEDKWPRVTLLWLRYSSKIEDFRLKPVIQLESRSTWDFNTSSVMPPPE